MKRYVSWMNILLFRFHLRQLKSICIIIAIFMIKFLNNELFKFEYHDY